MAASTKNLGGRPTKFTAETREKIYAALKKTLPHRAACWAARICPDTFYEWMKIAKEDKRTANATEYAEFSDTVREIESNIIANYIADLQTREKNWQAIAWILERRWRDMFGVDSDELRELRKTLDELKSAMEKK